MVFYAKIKDIDNEIDKLINSESLSLDMYRNITYLTSAKKAFEEVLAKSNINLPQTEKNPVKANFYAPVNELKDIAPNLNTFEERKIYFNMVDSLKF